tara:strand:- start:65 stop:304 length:240 start_codon:yes stop_codon:yes gene_type:complete
LRTVSFYKIEATFSSSGINVQDKLHIPEHPGTYVSIFSKELALEFEAIGVAHEAVKDGLCEGLLTDEVMSGFEWQLGYD